ncbi:MAG: caspase family protein [Verrucomicrobiaceae bacterium]|nr:caspase family protein [Verrucomicrobiaceae bacterium]
MTNISMKCPVAVCGLIGYLALSLIAAGAERMAIVVGNAAYEAAPRLDNALRDARAVAALLQNEGFSVTLVEDGTTEAVYSAVGSFRESGGDASVGLFYFAGHGVEVAGRNYLLPVNAVLETEAQLRTQAIAVDSVLADMKEAGVKAKLVILDCCRDNPLKRSWVATRGVGRGLAEVKEEVLPDATMIMFAAGPGQPALDGEGRNSPFTTALLENFARPGISAFDAFLSVSDAVDQSTQKRQTPWLKFDGAGKVFRDFTIAHGELGASRPVVVTNRPVPGSGMSPNVPTAPAAVPPNRGSVSLDQIFQGSKYETFNAYSRTKILLGVQSKLAQMGYYQGVPDGQTGSLTHEAIVRWQASNSLPANGLLSTDTLARLGMDGLAEQRAPLLTGTWRGTYYYGTGYTAQQRANPVSFDVVIPEGNGGPEFTAVYTEPYTGFGTAGPDGQMHGSLKGTVLERDGRIFLQFGKSYRYFTQPPADYLGQLDPATGIIMGKWGFSNGSGGTFKLVPNP